MNTQLTVDTAFTAENDPVQARAQFFFELDAREGAPYQD